jgi:hypothetical protein
MGHRSIAMLNHVELLNVYVNHLCMGHGFHGYVSLLEDIWWTTCPQTQGAVAVAMIDTSWRLARLKFILGSREHAESACVTQFLKLAGVSYPFWRLPKGQVITIIIGLLLCLLWTQLPKCVAMQAIGNTTIRIQYHKWPQHAERPFRGFPVSTSRLAELSVTRLLTCWFARRAALRCFHCQLDSRIITGNGATATTSKANGGTFSFAPKFWWGRAWAKKFGTRFRSDSDSCWITTNHLYLILINSILHFVYVLFVNSLKFKTQWDHRFVRWYRAFWSQPSYLMLFNIILILSAHISEVQSLSRDAWQSFRSHLPRRDLTPSHVEEDLPRTDPSPRQPRQVESAPAQADVCDVVSCRAPSILMHFKLFWCIWEIYRDLSSFIATLGL